MRNNYSVPMPDSLWLACRDNCEPFPYKIFKAKDEALRFLGTEFAHYQRDSVDTGFLYIYGALMQFDADTGERLEVWIGGPELRSMVLAVMPDLPVTKRYDASAREFVPL